MLSLTILSLQRDELIAYIFTKVIWQNLAISKLALPCTREQRLCLLKVTEGHMTFQNIYLHCLTVAMLPH